MRESSSSFGRRALQVFFGVALALAVLGLAFAALRPGAIPPVASADAVGSTAKGAALAKIGNCAACHGADYAWGVGIKTPFGTVYATDITPARSGLGGWSFTAFARAMRDGVSRDGHYLYPAFPYPHFRRLETGDLENLYAFLMQQPPVEATAPANRLMFPFGFRPLLAVWNGLFLSRSGPEKDRGAYLVDALGHCGACHAPRGLFGQERGGLSGGWAAGWYAPPLDASSPAPRAWSAEDLYAYLKTGLSERHAAAAGPMGEVTRSLSEAPDADLRAIAADIAALMPKGDRVPPPRAATGPGAALFAGACGGCHGEGAPMVSAGRPPLTFGTPLYESEPRDALAIVLRGLDPPTGRAGPAMPAYADLLGDAEIAELAAYMRARFTDLAPWPQDLTRETRAARRETAP